MLSNHEGTKISYVAANAAEEFWLALRPLSFIYV